MRTTYFAPTQVPIDYFPTQLSHIPRAPKNLWTQGTIPSGEHKFVTIVGSRKPTAYGKQITQDIVAACAGFPITIVSGLAYGIDALAHRTALEHNITTIAFPGSGLDKDVLYPTAHHNLAQQIIEQGGCLVSEFKNDQRALPWTFPVRNRLMAGIADVVVVIEAAEKSGSLITANAALEYGTTVLAVPGNITNPLAYGTNQLIYDGATPLINTDVLIHELGFRSTGNQPSKKYLYTEDEQVIADLLYEPQTRGYIMRESGMAMHHVSQVLSEMEIKGYITEEAGFIQIRP